jgi:hypothetical protein
VVDSLIVLCYYSNRLVQFDYQLNEIEVIEDTPKHEDHTYCYNSRGSQVCLTPYLLVHFCASLCQRHCTQCINSTVTESFSRRTVTTTIEFY